MENKTVVQALNEIMKAVGAISKTDRNAAQGFNFRGIDSVVNAVSPQLQKFGVIVLPSVEDYEYQSVEIGKNRTVMGHVKVKVTYTFVGPQGDSIKATVVAEAMDAGDKATTKAMSVAFRTALLQSLCLPTDDVDPDASSYERSEKPAIDSEQLISRLKNATTKTQLAEIKQFINVNKAGIQPDALLNLRDWFDSAELRISKSLNDLPKEELDIAVKS